MIVKYLFGVKGSEILSNQSICSTDFMNIELPFNKDNFIRSNISRASLYSIVTSEEYAGRLNAIVSNILLNYRDDFGTSYELDTFEFECVNTKVEKNEEQGKYKIFSDPYEEIKSTCFSKKMKGVKEFSFKLKIDYLQDSNASSEIKITVIGKKIESIQNEDDVLNRFSVSITPKGKLTVHSDFQESDVEVKNVNLEKGLYIRIETVGYGYIKFDYSLDGFSWIRVCDCIKTDNIQFYDFMVQIEPKINPFFYDFFASHIQLCCTLDTMVIAPHFESYERLFSSAIQSMHVPMVMLDIKSKEIIKYFVDLISRQFYINIGLNEFYVPGTRSYKNKNFMHVNFIYGVDTKRRVFKVLGFDNVLKYTEIGYEDFYHAIQREVGPTTKINLYKYDSKKYPYRFNVETTIKMLEAYMNGSNLVCISSTKIVSVDEKEPFVYGMNIYDLITQKNEYLCCFIKDKKIMYQIYEHTKIIIEMCEFMRKIGVIDDITYCTISPELNEISNKAMIILNIILKNSLSKVENVEEKIIERIIDLKNREKKALNVLVNKLKTYKGEKESG